MMRRTEAALWDAIEEMKKMVRRSNKRIKSLEGKVKALGAAPKVKKQEPEMKMKGEKV